MKSILVTGGLGFIGSHFIKYIFDKYDYNIFNIDLKTYAANPKNISEEIHNSGRYFFLPYDINQTKDIRRLIQNNNITFVYSIFTPNDLNNELKIILENNLLKRIFGINADETFLSKQTTIISDNPINLLHHQKIIISTDLTFTNSTTNSLSSWKEDHDEGIRNILLWLNCDEPPFTIIKYNNYELIDYRIDDKFIKNLNLYFYNEYKKPININKMLLHIIIEKKNISYN